MRIKLKIILKYTNINKNIMLNNIINPILTISIFAYLTITLMIWLYFARKVKNSKDYILSWKNLPLYIVAETTFSTWFWAETIIWTSWSVIKEWFMWIIEDPFWIALCLILIWFLFSRKLYKLNLITLWNFYKLKYWRKVEIVASIIIILSYFWWIAAQLLALWKIFNIVTWIETQYWILIASFIVILYTVMWWMYSIARVDFIQMIFIFVWLIFAWFEIVTKVWWFTEVFSKIPSSTFNMIPTLEPKEFLSWIAAWVTLWLWSIPQQDVYQRIMSSKNEKVASWWSITAWIMYLTVAMIPIFLWLIAKVAYPELLPSDFWTNSNSDTEIVLISLILTQTSIIIQILFFWALTSCIMSTASWALLAPSTILSENIIRPYFKHLDDKKFLLLNRYSVIFMSISSLFFALKIEVFIN